MKKIKKIIDKDDYILRAIPYLTPKQSKVMELRYIAGISTKKIAEMLKIEHNTASKIVLRAKKVIHNAIEAGIEPEEIKDYLKRPLTSKEKELKRIEKVRLSIIKGV